MITADNEISISFFLFVIKNVGVAGLEPATLRSQSVRSGHLNYTPLKITNYPSTSLKTSNRKKKPIGVFYQIRGLFDCSKSNKLKLWA